MSDVKRFQLFSFPYPIVTAALASNSFCLWCILDARRRRKWKRNRKHDLISDQTICFLCPGTLRQLRVMRLARLVAREKTQEPHNVTSFPPSNKRAMSTRWRRKIQFENRNEIHLTADEKSSHKFFFFWKLRRFFLSASFEICRRSTRWKEREMCAISPINDSICQFFFLPSEIWNKISK